MTDRSDNHRSRFGFDRGRHQFVEDRAGEHFHFDIGAQFTQPLCFPIEIFLILRKRCFEERGIKVRHPVKFLDVDENQFCPEPSRHRRGDLERLARRRGEISSADDWPLVFFIG